MIKLYNAFIFYCYLWTLSVTGTCTCGLGLSWTMWWRRWGMSSIGIENQLELKTNSNWKLIGIGNQPTDKSRFTRMALATGNARWSQTCLCAANSKREISHSAMCQAQYLGSSSSSLERKREQILFFFLSYFLTFPHFRWCEGHSCSVCGALVGFLLLPIAIVLATLAFILSAILIVLFMPVFIVFILPILIVTKCRRGQDSETVMKISEEQRCNDDIFSKVTV